MSPRATALAVPSEPAAVLPDKVRSLYAQTGVSLAGNLLGAAALVALFARSAPRFNLVAWSLLFLAVWGARLYGRLRYSQARADASTHRIANAQHWLVIWNTGAVASGAVWGAASWTLYEHGDAYQRAALVVIVYTYCVASITVLAPQFRIFLAFTSLCLLPLIARVATIESATSWQLAAVLLLGYLMNAALARAYRRTFHGTLALKLRTEQLAAQLAAEKATADAARREAETANRAKTQFFAAASHDLRQPLHAMGLFAEALRARSRGDEEVTHLVNSIYSSVDALEGLFGELLDITKIDTGGVEPQPQAFALRDLFARLRLQYEPTAFEKGLSLRLRGEDRVVYADPVLTDRILRNLLANAIRYTREGGVLLAARRRGTRVVVQVWDTGVGIAAAEQSRVFDEFYQVGGAQAPVAANDRKGLGLGLAIVKRLSTLIDAPLTLRSQPGRGTVFTLSLAAGTLPRPMAAPAAGARPAIGLTLDRRRIVVVEDEPAVREGLVVLLKGWGASIEAFDSASAAAAWARGQDTAPDLLILDYRLGDGTGIDALQALRGAFAPTHVPAILVTGSTMTGHEREAQQHDVHLLIKPVVPHKLRAMIAFKLGLR
ncbi:hybrid sensor histidine kinase/response regulator [Caldimonas sp. KR1-144]|uniref:ATP-binding response regulator n=1 Tax=Caldimonas sp. KR1-144 TaxID=3400911 RepID=UPI003C084839